MHNTIPPEVTILKEGLGPIPVKDSSIQHTLGYLKGVHFERERTKKHVVFSIPQTLWGWGIGLATAALLTLSVIGARSGLFNNFYLMREINMSGINIPLGHSTQDTRNKFLENNLLMESYILRVNTLLTSIAESDSVSPEMISSIQSIIDSCKIITGKSETGGSETQTDSIHSKMRQQIQDGINELQVRITTLIER